MQLRCSSTNILRFFPTAAFHLASSMFGIWLVSTQTFENVDASQVGSISSSRRAAERGQQGQFALGPQCLKGLIVVIIVMLTNVVVVVLC